jgi:hypothetical protein
MCPQCHKQVGDNNIKYFDQDMKFSELRSEWDLSWVRTQHKAQSQTNDLFQFLECACAIMQT